MLRLIRKLPAPIPCSARITLPFGLRQRSRFKANLDDGREAGVLLPRGGILRHGDCLAADDGTAVFVQAASEMVSTARAVDPMQVAHAAYHLGNRHVPLQLGENWLRYAEDHVLDAMLASLGLEMIHECAPFEPVGGAYSNHVHPHRRQHDLRLSE